MYYTYQCCGELDVEHSIKEDPVIICPGCGKEMTRKISAPPVHFKGFGFYQTDYRNPSTYVAPKVPEEK